MSFLMQIHCLEKQVYVYRVAAKRPNKVYNNDMYVDFSGIWLESKFSPTSDHSVNSVLFLLCLLASKILFRVSSEAIDAKNWIKSKRAKTNAKIRDTYNT